MNTKSLLLTIALILILPQMTSTGSAFKKQMIVMEPQTEIPASSEKNNRPSKNMDWAISFPADTGTSGQHHSDHKKESHCFHYDRFAKCRRRLLRIIVIKLVLVVTHISTIVVTTLHLMH